jgi:hypothetical protein
VSDVQESDAAEVLLRLAEPSPHRHLPVRQSGSELGFVAFDRPSMGPSVGQHEKNANETRLPIERLPREPA